MDHNTRANCQCQSRGKRTSDGS